MLRSFGPGEMIFIVALVVLLFGVFGAKRLPDAARSIGRSMRIFKSEVKEMRKDDSDATVPPSRSDELEGRVVDRTENGSAGPRVTEPPRREP